MQIDFERIVNFKCNSVALIIIEWRCKRNYTSRHQTIWNDSESHCAYYSGIYIINSTDDVTFFRQYSVYGCQQFSCKVQSSRWWCATPSDFVCNLWEELSIMNLSKCLFSEAICYFYRILSIIAHLLFNYIASHLHFRFVFVIVSCWFHI